MSQFERLTELARLIQVRNAVDLQMAELLGRPATPGNLGEFIAAAVFDIELAPSGVNPGHDGIVRSGPLEGKTVNIKLYSEDQGLLDIWVHPADYYLVLTGPRPKPVVGTRSLPRRIDSIYLFEMESLRKELTSRGVGIGVASSVRRADWAAAQIYPSAPNSPLLLTDDQIASLELFRGQSAD